MGEMTFYQVLIWLIMVFQPALERGKAVSESWFFHFMNLLRINYEKNVWKRFALSLNILYNSGHETHCT